jgi:hypothetical protein
VEVWIPIGNVADVSASALATGYLEDTLASTSTGSLAVMDEFSAVHGSMLIGIG